MSGRGQAALRAGALAVALAAGGVQVRLEPAGAANGIREGVGTGVVDFPPERVFRAVADLEHWEEWVPFLVAADAWRLPDGTVESAQRLEAPALGRPLVFTVRARAAVAGKGRARRWTLTWSHVPGSGNVAGHHGSWTLTEHSPGRTLATCRLLTDPGGDTPAWAMNQATHKMITWMFDSLPLQTNRGRYQDGE
ncbi:MAG TPA: SRPBCC family protein [Thermoanaerobaculia bacterium]